MHRTTLLTTILILLIAPPAASGQAAEGIGFEDASLDTMPPTGAAYGDLRAGSLTVDGGVVRASMQLEMLPQTMPGMAYMFVFSAGAQQWFAGVAFDPQLAYYYGTWISEEAGPGEILGAAGTYAPGPGGSIVVEFPLERLGQADVLSAPIGYVVDFSVGLLGLPPPAPAVVMIDKAVGEGELRIARGPGQAGAQGEPAPQDPSAAQAPPGESPPGEAAGSPAFAGGAVAEDDGGKRVPGAGMAMLLGAGLLAAMVAARRR